MEVYWVITDTVKRVEYEKLEFRLLWISWIILQIVFFFWMILYEKKAMSFGLRRLLSWFFFLTLSSHTPPVSHFSLFISPEIVFYTSIFLVSFHLHFLTVFHCYWIFPIFPFCPFLLIVFYKFTSCISPVCLLYKKCVSINSTQWQTLLHLSNTRLNCGLAPLCLSYWLVSFPRHSLSAVVQRNGNNTHTQLSWDS